MASPAVQTRNSGSQTTNATAHTVNLPSGIVSGDLILVFIAYDGAVTTTWPGSAGDWNEILDDDNTSVSMAIAWRLADGTEGSTIEVTSSGSEKSNHVSYRITGHENPATQAPEAVAPSKVTNSAPLAPIMSPTGGSKDYLFIACEGHNDGRTATTSGPPNYSQLQALNTGGATGCGIGTAERQYTTATDPNGNFAIDASEDSIGSKVAVHPPTSSDQEATPSATAIPLVVPTPSFDPGAVSLTPTPVAIAGSVPTPTITPGTATLTPTPVGLPLAVPTPTFTPGPVTLSPTPVVATLSAPTPAITNLNTLSPSPVVFSASVPTPTLTPGVATISPAPVTIPGVVPTPAFNPGSVTLTPTPVVATFSVPTPTFTNAQTINPSPVAIVASVPTPTFTPGVATLTPTPVAIPTVVVSPVFSPGAANLAPSPVVAAFSVPTPLVESSATDDDDGFVGVDTVRKTNIQAKLVRLKEEADPGTPPAGTAFYWLRDNAGTQEWVVRFSNGTTKVLANDI
jgi:hypothetical protein